ncbi:MAG: hypothetical protein HFH72_02640 [Lachnospiraceae bacterium]|nr:hypothetical protein [Lachnospiraceae bacterium]
MIRENDKEREEKILRAIGDLPEDMVAQAAEYRRPKHRLAGFSVWKGLAMAACAAIVLLGGARAVSVMQKQPDGNIKDRAYQPSEGNYSDNTQENYGGDKDNTENGMLQQSGGEDGDVSDSSAAKGTGEIKLWAAASMESGKLDSDGSKDVKKQGNRGSEETEEKNGVQVLMEEGETIALKTKKMKSAEGEKISVITFHFGQPEDDVVYSLHSQTSNCRIVTVAHNGLQKYVNLPNGECASGDAVAFEARHVALVDWEYNLVPEWQDKENLCIIDVIDIYEKGEGSEEKNRLGRIVIGKQTDEEERYYGIYQSKDD